MKLICFPHAGGSTLSFHSWENLVPKGVEIIPFELRGRGSRSGTGFYSSFPDAIDEISNELPDSCLGEEFAFLGHSMGSWIAYALTQRLHRESRKLPRLLILSGKEPPYELGPSDVRVSSLPFAEFKTEVLRYAWAPEKIFEDRAIASRLVPVLRADFHLIESYQDHGLKSPLPVDTLIMRGTENCISHLEAQSWRTRFTGQFDAVEFTGGHFYLFEDPKKVIGKVLETIEISKKRMAYA